MQTTYNPFPADFITKISKANALYKDAFLTLVPEDVRPHLVTIDQECHALLTALFASAASHSHTFRGGTTAESSVKKVDIE